MNGIPDRWQLWARDVWPVQSEWDPIGKGTHDEIENLMTNLRAMECSRELLALPADETPDVRRADCGRE